MSWRYKGRASVDPSNPQAFAVCDRHGGWVNHSDLQWQFDVRGTSLQNLRILVCKRCLDRPSPFYGPVIVPPDPLPIANPRPEWFALDENNYFTDMSGGYLVTEGGDNLVIEGGGNNVGEEPL